MFRCKFITAFLLVIFSAVAAAAQKAIRTDGFKIIHTYPHDADAFTQGLVYVDGHLYESTGRNGMSSIRLVDLYTGKVLQRFDVDAKYFGEGLTSWGSDLVQITWQSQIGFVHDRFSFTMKKTFHYSGEGWGLTHDDKQLILSDGTPVIRFLDPKSFAEVRRLSVTDENGRAVSNLNELEYIHGEIYANIWMTNQIVRISPSSGKVLGRIDLSGLIDKSELSEPGAVLNGIAYDAKGDRLFVTGKLWPKLFEIKVVRKP